METAGLILLAIILTVLLVPLKYYHKGKQFKLLVPDDGSKNLLITVIKHTLNGNKNKDEEEDDGEEDLPFLEDPANFIVKEKWSLADFLILRFFLSEGRDNSSISFMFPCMGIKLNDEYKLYLCKDFSASDDTESNMLLNEINEAEYVAEQEKSDDD